MLGLARDHEEVGEVACDLLHLLDEALALLVEEFEAVDVGQDPVRELEVVRVLRVARSEQ